MNDAVYVFFFDAELLRLGRSVTAKLLLFSFEFFLSPGCANNMALAVGANSRESL
jgi:hypothetical protein